MKTFSPEAILALKEGLTHIYWKRKDIKTFVYHTIENKIIVATIDFESSTKEESISILIDRMVSKQDMYHDDLLRLFDAVLHFKDFSHLNKWDGAETKIANAKNAVEALRNHAKGFFQLKEEQERSEERRKAYELMQHEKEVARAKVSNINNSFLHLVGLKNNNERGYAFEAFLNDLFEYYDLDPRRSFKIIGEQIDGAFTFENTDYIIEAKWQKKLVNAGELYKFAGKISAKLKITLGLFISFNGYSSEALDVDAPGIKSMILMDGSDLMAVLDERIDLTELLYRKRRHASETGNIYLKVNDFL
ncbi:MAG: restriction endonuclease [Deltaproteobacteria bacterium]|jgi:hypothetical protein|nr:restriction endonuclease [Deltaproteobacteria bacterium]